MTTGDGETLLALDAIDWDRVAGASGVEHAPASARVRAYARSLAGLFASDYAAAARGIEEARAADPLNPLHAFRLAALHLRFGRVDEAAGLAQAVCDSLPDPRLPLYLRGLATLRQREY